MIVDQEGLKELKTKFADEITKVLSKNDVYVADLHVHSKYSRATSKNISIENLALYGKKKGLSIIGTGDFTHPKHFQELNKFEEEEGLLKHNGMHFVWQTEVNLVFEDEGIRKVHLVVLAPNREVVKNINESLSDFNLEADGRVTLTYSLPEFVDLMLEIDDKIEIIPAHIWTPWFGVMGSKSGYNSLKEAFKDRVNKIHAIETGLSSDPEMNWRFKELESRTIMSNSDSHSHWPWRVGREATIFKLRHLNYDEIIKAIRNNEIVGTIEVDPSYGKYHFDGHRKCNVFLDPKDSMKRNNICPICGKKLTLGVLHRVEELADHERGYIPNNFKPYATLLPLNEIIAYGMKRNKESKAVMEKYWYFVNRYGNELNALLNFSKEDVKKVLSKEAVSIFEMNKKGILNIRPGYDGVYGEIFIGDWYSEQRKKLQKTLLDF